MHASPRLQWALGDADSVDHKRQCFHIAWEACDSDCDSQVWGVPRKGRGAPDSSILEDEAQ